MIAGLLVSLTACDPSISPADNERNALAIDNGHALQIFIADGPQSCADPVVRLIVGPGCASPSWQLVFSVPAQPEVGQPIDLFEVPDTPGVGIQFGMQEGACHQGEPEIDSGTVTLGPRESAAGSVEMDVALSVVARTSFDPSGTYRARLCD